MLHSNFIKTSPERLLPRIIVTPIAKANGNIAVICEGVYDLTLWQQLGLNVSYASSP